MTRSHTLEYSHACLSDPDTRKPASGTMPKKMIDRPSSFR